ncbi:MAG: GYD domain-containing protein [Rhodospirillales bacterium]|nr:GYD domain-containing protein [Rhodospirillales bacterium]
MPYYMTRFRYAPEQFRALVDKPQDRAAEVRKAIEGFGGKLHQFFFAFGEWDGVLIVEFDSAEKGTAFLMTVASSGAVAALETTVLITPEAARRSMEMAGEMRSAYRPPSG